MSWEIPIWNQEHETFIQIRKAGNSSSQSKAGGEISITGCYEGKHSLTLSKLVDLQSADMKA